MTRDRTLAVLLLGALAFASPGRGPSLVSLAYAQDSDSKKELDRVNSLAEEQRLDEAAKLCAEVLKKEPQNPKALYQMGWICNERHQFEEAVKYLKQIEGRSEDAHLIWRELGLAYRKLARADEAKEAYEKACKAKEDYSPAWVELGDVLFTLKKDYIGASRAYEKALSLAPHNPVAAYRLGWCLNDDGQPAKALPFLQQAVRLEPKYKVAYTEIAFCWVKLNKPKDALVAAQKALSQDKNDIQAHYYAGQAYALLKQKNQAQEQLEILKKLSLERAKKLESYLKAAADS